MVTQLYGLSIDPQHIEEDRIFLTGEHYVHCEWNRCNILVSGEHERNCPILQV